jgi:Ca-activated chloride channel family protein
MPTPSASPAITAGPPATPTVAPIVTPTPGPTPGPVVLGDPAIDAPASIPADTVFYVNWVGPNNTGDYITIVAAGTRTWNGEPYFYTYGGTPRPLQSSTTPGEYEIWYVNGANGKPKLKRPITVTAFVGSLDGPDSVAAGTEFDVAWTGPRSPGDYVTIEPVGATEWVDESFFYASSISPTGRLTAPLSDGPHELWYVASDKTVMLREPITVTPLSVSVIGPASATHGASFTVSWTGPDARGDFITIVPAGAPEGTYLSYGYTSYGNPVTLTAPPEAGEYELRYVYGSGRQTLVAAAIQIN